MKEIVLYTDGACSFNPGPGGYGFIILDEKDICEYSGYVADTTNNQMELTAVIKGLNQIEEPSNVTVYTDSAYTMNAFEQNWIDNWKKNNWKNSAKKDVANKGLWLDLLQAIDRHNKVKWIKVKGHSDNQYNNRCDAIARAAIENRKGTLD